MRRRVRKQAVSIALFPFLAVLICTMGALVVLLVLLVQQAKVEAETLVAERDRRRDVSQEALSADQLALEDAQWRREVLEQQRQEKQQELADRRLALSHIEDHIRRLEESAKTLLARLKLLDDGKTADDESTEPLQSQLTELRRAIAEKEQQLGKKREALAQSERSYALIPYEGRRGTRRVPLYVECVEVGVILQPEGLLLSAADFDGPTGPGNPLDAALRAKREYLAKASGGIPSEPYPLLVVRPSGVIAYHAARAAMKAWEDEFGYELVSEELNLDFGERDERMDLVLRKTVRDARRRQAQLAAAMPRQYRRDDALPSFSPERGEDVAAATFSGGGRGVGQGGGGMGVGDSRKFSDGRAPKGEQTAGGGPAAPPQPGESPKPAQQSTNEPKAQHGGGRQKGVAGGVAGAKMGKSVPAGMTPQRGANWGLPDSQGRTFAVARPIRVVCFADRLVLLSDRREAPRPQEFALSPQTTREEIDGFVRAIQKQMEGWGLAAENAYWKPELHVEVAADALERFEEIRAALEGSGIELHRKTR